MTLAAARDDRDARRALILLILGGAAARFVFAGATGLGIDETYMVAVGRHIELGYFDHPPLAWWLARLAGAIAGEHNWALRAPFIMLFALSTWLMYHLGRSLFGPAAGLVAALALNAAPVLGVTTASWVLPDGPLDAALLAGALCFARLFFAPGASPALWLAAGACGGIALLSKFHGIFLFAGAGLFLLTSPPHRRWILSPWPYLGAALALLIAAPGIIWNMEHGWASFAFQGARAATKVFRPWMPFVALAGQAAFLAPWIWGPLVWAACRDARKLAGDPRSWLLICLGVGPIALFTFVTAWSDQRPYFHWAAPGYLMLFPLLGRMLAEPFAAGTQRFQRWIGGALAFNLSAAAVVACLSLVPGIAGSLRAVAPNLTDPMAEMVDWTDAADYLRARESGVDPRVFVVARRWYEAAKIDFALHGARDVICVGEDCRGYDFISTRVPHAGDDAIVMIPENAPAALAPIAARFTSMEPMPPLVITHLPFAIARLAVFRARNYDPAAR